jgi:hypothetical protein
MLTVGDWRLGLDLLDLRGTSKSAPAVSFIYEGDVQSGRPIQADVLMTYQGSASALVLQTLDASYLIRLWRVRMHKDTGRCAVNNVRSARHRELQRVGQQVGCGLECRRPGRQYGHQLLYS